MPGHPLGQQMTTLRPEHPRRVITHWLQHVCAAVRRTDRPQRAQGFDRPVAFAYDHVGQVRWAAVHSPGRVESLRFFAECVGAAVVGRLVTIQTVQRPRC
jgi:hypothetical protein